MSESRSAGPSRRTLVIEPLDVLFCGGGRPFGPASRVSTGTPMPQMTAGAIRTWLLRRAGVDFGALGTAIRRGASFEAATAAQNAGTGKVGRLGFRGPWFARNGDRLSPAPGAVHKIEEDVASRVNPGGRFCRLDPLSPRTDLPGWAPAWNGMRPLWLRSSGTGKPTGGYLSSAGLARYLGGGTFRACDLVAEDELFDRETRHGIGIERNANTAADGLIYQIQVLRFRPGVALEVDVLGEEVDLEVVPQETGVIALGGEGRRATVRASDPVPWPPVARLEPPGEDAGRNADGADGRLVMLTTPGLFGGWRPPGLELVSASVPGNLSVSGWDLARGGPKPTRFAAAAGSVYFLAPGAGVPAPGRSLCNGEDGALGWGSFVTGEWSYV